MNARRRAPLRAISLFTGAGGLDLGFEAAGFRTSVAVEMDPVCVVTLQANRRWPVIAQSIQDVSTTEILETAGLKVGDADVLIGGPPCQPFSKAGYWRRGDSLRLSDPRSDTLSAFLRVVEEAQPRTFLLENVKGLTFSGKDEGLKLLLSATESLNRRVRTQYRLSWAVLQAADYGVPQLRERVFVVGQRDGVEFRFPEPHHEPSRVSGSGAGLDSAREPYRTAWDALAGLPEPKGDLCPRGKWAELLPSIPEGENYLWHTSRKGGLPLFGWRTRYWSFLLKLAKGRPAWTISARPGPATGPFHWKSRRLSVEEMKRLQTFPDDYKITGTLDDAQRQLGNAVPSLLAEVLATEIRSQLLGRPRSGVAFTLAVPHRRTPPRRERRRPVPSKYRQYEGDHAPHPGPGLGPGVRKGKV